MPPLKRRILGGFIDLATVTDSSLVDSTSEKQAILEIRTHALWYIKGMPKSAYIKNKICKTKNSEDLFKILNDYLGDLDD